MTCINKFIVAMSCSLLSDYFTIQRLLTLNFELKVTTILNVLTTLASNLFHRAVWLPAAWMTVLVYQTWRKTRSHALAKYLGSETDVKLCFPQPMDMSFQVGHISMSSCLNFWQKVLKISLNEACPCWSAQTRFASRMTRPSLFEEQYYCLNTKAILKNHLKKESKKEYFQTYDKKWVAFLGDSTWD